MCFTISFFFAKRPNLPIFTLLNIIQVYVQTWNGQNLSMTIVRDEYPANPMVLRGINQRAAAFQQYQPVVMLQKGYTIHWNGKAPNVTYLYLINFNKYVYFLLWLWSIRQYWSYGPQNYCTWVSIWKTRAWVWVFFFHNYKYYSVKSKGLNNRPAVKDLSSTVSLRKNLWRRKCTNGEVEQNCSWIAYYAWFFWQIYLLNISEVYNQRENIILRESALLKCVMKDCADLIIWLRVYELFVFLLLFFFFAAICFLCTDA